MSTRIVEVTAIPLARNLAKTFAGGTYSITSRYTMVTQIRLENEVCGETYGGDEERYQKEVAEIINGPYQELLLGQDVFDVERCWDAMFKCQPPSLANRGIHTIDLANKSIIMQAIAAVDIALWDTIGKAINKPLYKILGAYRNELPVIAICGYHEAGKGEKEFRNELLRYKKEQLAGIKMKVGRVTPAEDAERVRFAREAVGEDFVIACDANQAWTVEEALEFSRLVRKYNIRWLEEPIQWYDQLRGLAQVRAASGIPVVAGQGEISRFGCRDLALAGAVDILNVDATIAGGVTEWRRIAGMASMLHIGMAHHEEPQVALHLLSSISHGLYVEIFHNPERDPLWFELPAVRPEIRDGCMFVPQGPGLGIPLRAKVIDQYRASIPV
jgi:L-alanine-DL-glutamate epimerase-like enolase superfamily enzyme